jgi:adenylate kinase family enzyme
VLRERVLAATEGDGWVTDSTYHGMLGEVIAERADIVVWLDLPVPLVMWRLIRRSLYRYRHNVVLWNGNLEPGLRDQWRYLIWPGLKTAFANRRVFPARLAPFMMRRLRSDDDVHGFVQSIQATASTSGSSTVRARQNTPPLIDT